MTKFEDTVKEMESQVQDLEEDLAKKAEKLDEEGKERAKALVEKTEEAIRSSIEKVKGIIHTEALNALEIKKTDRAEKYLDKNVCYLHLNDSLKFAVEEIERTNSYYFLVLDESDSLAGFFTIQMLLDYLLN